MSRRSTFAANGKRPVEAAPSAAALPRCPRQGRRARLWFFAGQKGPGLFTGLSLRALPKTAAARRFSHGGCRTAAKGSARTGLLKSVPERAKLSFILPVNVILPQRFLSQRPFPAALSQLKRTAEKASFAPLRRFCIAPHQKASCLNGVIFRRCAAAETDVPPKITCAKL